MELTKILIQKLLATENDFQFMFLIFENKIEEEEWRKNDILLKHYEKVTTKTREALGKFNYKIAEDIPGFCKPNKKNLNKLWEKEVKEPYRGISDILNGMSKGKIKLGYIHPDPDYWNKPFRVEKETWANYGSMIYIRNEEAWITANNIFPSITNQINVILRNFEEELKW